MKRILVAVGFDKASEKAVAFADTLSKSHGAHVELFYALRRPALATYAALGEGSFAVLPELDLEQAAENARKKLLELWGSDSADARVEVCASARDALLERVTSGSFEAVVMGAARHGLAGELMLGSLASAVVANAEVPVFLVNEHTEISPIDHIGVGFDYSADSTRAADGAVRIAKGLDAKVSLIHAIASGIPWLSTLSFDGVAGYDPEALVAPAEAAMKSLIEAKGWTSVEPWIEVGAKREVFAKASADRGIDLLVLARRHGKDGQRHIGSTVRRISRHVSVPVLVV